MWVNIISTALIVLAVGGAVAHIVHTRKAARKNGTAGCGCGCSGCGAGKCGSKPQEQV